MKLLMALWRFGILVVALIYGLMYLHGGDPRDGFLALGALIVGATDRSPRK